MLHAIFHRAARPRSAAWLAAASAAVALVIASAVSILMIATGPSALAAQAGQPHISAATAQPSDDNGSDDNANRSAGQCRYHGGHPTLKRGSSDHAAVAHAQCLLRNYHGYTSLVVDGIFGPRTEATVRAFQHDCAPPADGIVGRITWRALHPDTGGHCH